MMAAAAVLAVVLTGPAQRDVLMARWTHASRATVPENRRLRDGVAPPPSALAPLRTLAAAELSVPGRYRLNPVKPTPRSQTWLERLWGWVRDRWNALMQALFGRVRVNPKAAAVIGELVVVLLVLAVVAAAIRIAFVYGRRDRRAASIRALVPDADAATLYAMAAGLAEGGEYAAAAQLLFRATLALLDVRGTLRDDASATVGEIRQRLPGRDVLGAFDAIASAFVAGTYAERPIDATQWQRAREAYLTLAAEPTA